MDHKIVFIIALCTIILSTIVSATPPSPPPCYEVKNPTFYKNLVFESEIYGYFQGWEMKNIYVPCQYERGPISVILQYEVPKFYSPNNLNYYTTIIFSFEDGQLINSNDLIEVFKNYKQHIENFESKEAIKFFIETTRTTEVKHSELKIFSIESKPREFLNYNFIDNSLDSLSFVNPVLIENLNLFIPKISTILQIDEFKKNKGINFIEYGDNRISIYEDFSCPTCESYFMYDINQMFSTSYSLDNNFEWKTFPEILQAHKIIKEKLLTGELSDCTIGTGNMHTYTIVRYHYSPSEAWFMTVALKCDSGTRWKDAFIRMNSEGTYDRLENEMDYHQKKITPSNNNTFYEILIGLVILLSILFLIIKISKK